MTCPACRAKLRSVMSWLYREERLDGSHFEGSRTEYHCAPCDRTWWGEFGEPALMTPEQHEAWLAAKSAALLPRATVVKKRPRWF